MTIITVGYEYLLRQSKMLLTNYLSYEFFSAILTAHLA